jgi:hypothetical protein
MVTRCELCPRRRCLGDELKAPKVKGFTNGEVYARHAFTVSGDDERRCVNHQNIQRKLHCKSPFLVRQLSVFSTPIKNRGAKITHSCFEVAL